MIFIMILAILHNLTHFWYPIVAVVTKIIESTSSQIITKMEDDGDHDDDDEADDDEEEKDYDEETDGEEEKDDDEDSVDHRKLSDRKWSGSMEGTWHPPSPARDDHDDDEVYGEIKEGLIEDLVKYFEGFHQRVQVDIIGLLFAHHLKELS